MAEYKLEFRNISKAYPGVQALNHVSFGIREGVVHALVGENGAGKSTLMKILNGLQRQDSGEILINGDVVDIANAHAAIANGIAMIFQELQIQKTLTIEESLFVNNLPVKHGMFVDWKKVHEDTVEILKHEDFSADAKTKLENLSISDNQLLEIMKATVIAKADIIIMDEPTSSLTQHETERLIEKVKQLRREGKTIIYISHRLDEIFSLADDVTILRDGQHIATRSMQDVSRNDLISMQVGRELTNLYPAHTTSSDGEIIFEANHISSEKFKDVSFHVRKGEIVGFAGLVGAGRTEICRSVAGFDPDYTGQMRLHGKTLENKTIRQAMDMGVVMATEDRRKYGLVAQRSIRENVALTVLKKLSNKAGFVRRRDEQKEVKTYFDRMRIKAKSAEVLAGTLSGGNQQKVVLAKSLICEPELLIMDEPTRGIDVGAKYDIYVLMNEIAAQEKGIIFVSSEMPELIGMCDRIYVVHEGEITGELQRKDFSQERIMHYASGGTDADLAASNPS